MRACPPLHALSQTRLSALCGVHASVCFSGVSTAGAHACQDYDWSRVLEEDQFVVEHGEKIHPIHVVTERFQRQSAQELKALQDEKREIQVLRAMVEQLMVRQANDTTDHSTQDPATASREFWEGR